MALSPEALLISSIIENRDFKTAVRAGLTVEMFHAYSDEWLYVESYFQRYKKEPTKLVFKNRFPQFPYRTNVDDTEHLSNEVRSTHARYELTSVMRDCTEMIGAGDIDKAVAFMTFSMNKVAAGMGNTGDLDIVNDWNKTFSEAETRRARFEEFGRSGIATGFETLDSQTGGISPGQMWTIGARLGERKSWTLMRIAAAAVMADFSVHYTALEQSGVEVAMRAHNFLSGEVGKQVFQSQALMLGTDPDMKEYRSFLRNLKTRLKAQFTVSDKRDIGLVEFRGQLERNPCDLWLLDYMTLANNGGDGGWQDIGKLSKGVRALAGDYGVGCVTAAQLNRTAAGVKGTAGNEALAESDAIGRDSDVVVMLRQMSNSVTMMRCTKNRNGRGGFKWYCHFDPAQGFFKEIPFDRAQDLIDRDRVNDGDDDK